MELLYEAAKAVSALAQLENGKINRILADVADRILAETEHILEANRRDLACMDQQDPKYDRLQLTADRIQGMAVDMKHVAALPSPVGKLLKETVRPNGLVIRKVTVPFGVVGVIYEARPNVTPDVFSLCLKSGNVCVLKGSHDAWHTNSRLVAGIHEVLRTHGVPETVCTLLPPDRATTLALLHATGTVDVIIPRGSQGLIHYVRENARVPVIETGAGICHTYFDEYGDLEKGREIVLNAKTRRVSVCNALDCLIIHEKRLTDLPALCAALARRQVVIYADEKAFRALTGSYPAELLEQATSESFGTEFLDYKMSIRTVDGLQEALDHIARYSSRHSEAIITEDPGRSALFQKLVDAACVYTNASTAFTDGAQFGLGAEIGISTQKLHARGPMGLEELTSYKYLIFGKGQTRE